MKCPNCGSENQFEGAAFCRNCHEPLDTPLAENKGDSEEKEQGAGSSLQAPSVTSWRDPAADQPQDAPPAESGDDSEDKKQGTDLNLQAPPETSRQDPVDDEPLKLSDPIDFMINEIPDEVPQEEKDSEDDVSRAAAGSNPAINREDEFRLSISGGSVGSTVKLEEAINKAIASMNISDDLPEEVSEDADPGESPPQEPPQQAPESSDAESDHGLSTTDQENSQETSTDTQEKDSVKPAEMTTDDEHEVKETETEPQHQDAAQTAPVDSQDQKPPLEETTEVPDHDETSEIEADKHVPSSPPKADMGTAVEKPAFGKEGSHEEKSPTKKVQATSQWNSVLSIKPGTPAEKVAGAAQLPQVSRSKGVILLSGNNLILTGGRRVVSGDEVKIGDQTYEVKVKPERFSRNNILMAAGAALLVIIIMLATFVGGGDGRLVGILVDGRANYPLGEQTVRIAELNKSVKTNLAGFFIFDDLSPGLYTLQYVRNGNAVSEVRIAILEGDITTVTLHTDDTSGRISGN